MRSIVHISDLHFGDEDRALVEALGRDVAEIRPTLVAVSGELTQRARRREFLAARRFLEGLGVPVIIVPGNHDIPLFNPYRRFVKPTRKFERYISSDLTPLYADGELAVVGVNSARSNVLKEGRISHRQIDDIRRCLSQMGPQALKVVVVHHPLVPHPDDPARRMLGRGRELLEVAQECGLDLVLAGHTHLGYGDDARTSYETVERSILVFQAGTATSRSLRGGESNSYNLITADRPRLCLTVRAWNGEHFVPEFSMAYRRDDHEWLREETHDGRPAATLPPQGASA
jgi:3',5'-cyclic AMP phosphodiesterase CpdA